MIGGKENKPAGAGIGFPREREMAGAARTGSRSRAGAETLQLLRHMLAGRTERIRRGEQVHAKGRPLRSRYACRSRSPGARATINFITQVVDITSEESAPSATAREDREGGAGGAGRGPGGREDDPKLQKGTDAARSRTLALNDLLRELIAQSARCGTVGHRHDHASQQGRAEEERYVDDENG